MSSGASLQERYAPHGVCFGCGPKNPSGLHLRSFAEGDAVVATWRPQPHHAAFPGVLNGGIVGALLDCHSNWAAATALLRQSGAEKPATTVTSDFHLSLLAPAPLDEELELWARAKEVQGRRVRVEATLSAKGKAYARSEGVFVAVKPGHPAYGQW